MRIQIYSRDELWKMTPRRLRLELKKMSDFGKDELVQEQSRLNRDAKLKQKRMMEDRTIRKVEKIRQAITNSDETETTERNVVAHVCGYKNVIMQIIDKKENRR